LLCEIAIMTSMYPFTFIFTGKSGCGKGTQAELLTAKLKAADATRKIYYLETGKRFRDFIAVADKSYARPAHILSKHIMESGERQPDFLAIWNWAHLMIDDFDMNDHLVLDGTPRSLPEAKILEGAMKFFNRKHPFVIHINVSKDWSRERLRKRGRADDKSAAQNEIRLEWFDTDVWPAIEYFKNDPAVRYIEINGEQSIEKVHSDVIEAVLKLEPDMF
jgi:adenylate kinase